MPREQKIVLKGWDRPLVVDWDFQTGLLRLEIQRLAPGRGSGNLKEAFEHSDTAVINEEGNVIDITVGKQHKAWPYAKIQEHGGTIPAFDIRKAQRAFKSTYLAMVRGRKISAGRYGRWFRRSSVGGYKPVMVAWIGGMKRFFTKRGPIHIMGSHYVERGVHNWWRKLCGASSGVGGGAPVGGATRTVFWSKEHYSRGIDKR